MMNSTEFVNLVRDIVRDELSKQEVKYKIAQVILPKGDKWTVRFAGEDLPTEKGYSYLAPYQPQLGDRVLMAKVKGTYVILGKLEGGSDGALHTKIVDHNGNPISSNNPSPSLLYGLDENGDKVPVKVNENGEVLTQLTGSYWKNLSTHNGCFFYY